MLRGKFAESAYRTALERGDNSMLEECRNALSNAPYPKLVMSFAACAEFRNEMKCFMMQVLPMSLMFLALDITNIEFQHHLRFSGLGELQNMLGLRIIGGPYDVGVNEDRWEEIARLKGLEKLELEFEWHCKGSIELAKVFAGFSNLTDVRLTFAPRSQLSRASMRSISSGLDAAPSLVLCHLRFMMQSMSLIGDCICGASTLRELCLVGIHSGSTTATSVAQALSKLCHLNTLKVDFSGSKLASIDEVGKAIMSMPQLQHFSLLCSEGKLSSIQTFAAHLRTLNGLLVLHLTFKQCRNLRSVTGLGGALQCVQLLRELHLDFKHCIELNSLDELLQGLEAAHFGCLQRLSLNTSFDCQLSLPGTKFVSLEKTPKLKSLDLRLACCGLASIEEFKKEEIHLM